MKSKKTSHLVACVLLAFAFTSLSFGQNKQEPLLAPTYANVAYGEHPQQILDFWVADVGGRGPLVIYIHGGGFTGGSKDKLDSATVRSYVDSGINFASVEYRFLLDAKLPAAHDDAVRALQFIRSKAKEWNFDKTLVGAYGGSAGAQLAAYLAWHDDMADPDSTDPIARESTRLTCVAPLSGQATMDFNWWIENIPGYDKPHRDISEYIDLQGVALQALIKELSIMNHISSDDPPVFMRYGMKPDDQVPDKNADGWKIHHINFGIAMDDLLRRAGVEVTLKYPGPVTRYENEHEFFVDKLVWRGGGRKNTRTTKPPPSKIHRERSCIINCSNRAILITGKNIPWWSSCTAVAGAGPAICETSLMPACLPSWRLTMFPANTKPFTWCLNALVLIHGRKVSG